MITAKQYTDTYVRYTKMLRDTGNLLDLLQEAVNCIYDLTGDRCFLKEVTASIERRKHEINSGTKTNS